MIIMTGIEKSLHSRIGNNPYEILTRLYLFGFYKRLGQEKSKM